MASETVRIQATVGKQLNNDVDKSIDAIGMSRSALINMFYKMLDQKGISWFLETAAELDLDRKLNDSLNKAADRGMTSKAKMSKSEFKKMWMDDSK